MKKYGASCNTFVDMTVVCNYCEDEPMCGPCAIKHTIDFDSLKEPHTMTLRERDTMQQIRVEVFCCLEIYLELKQFN